MDGWTIITVFLTAVLFSGLSVSDAYKYLGCHKDGEVRLLDKQFDFRGSLTIELCVNHCKSSGYRYAGLQYRFECFCDNKRPSFKTLVDEEDCDQSCEGNEKEKCGGNYRLNVYDTKDENINAVAEKFLGCYTDTAEVRTLMGYEGYTHLLTPELCVGSCYRRGFRLAGMQYGKECFCGDSVDASKKADASECSEPCQGDNNYKCGGNWRLSVYLTGISDNGLDDNNYIGCFNDNNEQFRLLSAYSLDFKITNTPRKCMNLCLSEGYKFSGTQYGFECFCGNMRPPQDKKIPENRCSIDCTGNSKLKCGGHWSLMVYATGTGKPIIPELLPPDEVPVTTSSPVDTAPCKKSQTTVKGVNACKEQIIFKEDFVGRNIDEGKWKHDIIIPRIPDAEFVIFSGKNSNMYVRDGKLFVKPTLLDEDTVLSGKLLLQNCTGSQYTEDCEKEASSFNIIPPIESARINTKASFSFKYGKVQIRAKLPQGDWIVPNLWLEPSFNKYGRGYDNGRIMLAFSRGNRKLTSDGLEIGAQRLENGVRFGIGEKVKSLFVEKDKSDPWNSQFHDFTFIWTPKELSFKVDNFPVQKLSSSKLSESAGFSEEESKLWRGGGHLAPFDQEFYLTVGLSAGGMRDFPDDCESGNYRKPWKDWNTKALVNFWKSKDSWYSTWSENSALQIDSIKVTAL